MTLFPPSFWHFIDMNVFLQHCPKTRKHCFQFTEAELQGTVSTLANITSIYLWQKQEILAEYRAPSGTWENKKRSA